MKDFVQPKRTRSFLFHCAIHGRPKVKVMLPFSTYVLHSLKDQKFYIGYSSQINRRIQQHHEGDVPSTKGRRPLKLVYYESYMSQKDALRRESYFKSTAGKRTLKLMLRDTLSSLSQEKP